MLLEARDITKAFGSFKAVGSASVTLERGDILGLIGPNGAGKSTFFNCLTGDLALTSGRVLFEGHDITSLSPEGWRLFVQQSVENNLLLGATPLRDKARASALLERVYEIFPRLKERRSQRAGTMSGGERQMVAIGRAMMSAPTILMLDEPSLGLAPFLCTELFRTLARIKEAGVGIFLVEQNAKQSLAIADRGYLLDNGHIVGADTAEALRKDEKVKAAYLGE